VNVSVCCKEDFKCTSHLIKGEMRRDVKICTNNYCYHAVITEMKEQNFMLNLVAIAKFSINFH